MKQQPASLESSPDNNWGTHDCHYPCFCYLCLRSPGFWSAHLGSCFQSSPMPRECCSLCWKERAVQPMKTREAAKISKRCYESPARPWRNCLCSHPSLAPHFSCRAKRLEKLATSQKAHQGPQWHLWADGTLRRFWIKCSEFPCSAKSQWLPSWLWTPMIATSSPSVMPPYCWCCS